MANRPTEARAYGPHKYSPALVQAPSICWSLSRTQPAVSAYGADQALHLIDTSWYKAFKWDCASYVL